MLKTTARQLKKEIMKSLSKNWFQLNKEERMILELALNGLTDLIDYDSLSLPCQHQIIDNVERALKLIRKEEKMNWFDRLIAELQTRYKKLNFYPHLYAGEWHVSIQDGNIQYRLYPYHNRGDCIAECRILNRRYNA
jgi:hypothetical protein